MEKALNIRKGFAIAGNLIVDQIKMTDGYPECGMLVNITETGMNVGGLACNTAVGLKKLDGTLPVLSLGKTGNDGQGEYIKKVLSGNGVDIKHILAEKNKPTSFTDVMTDINTGSRTFFHYRGANAEFGIGDIDFDGLNTKFFHIGYALLLDKFDAQDAEYGTVMARALKTAQGKGMITSMDVVSESGGRFKKVVTPSLKYCDNIIINEIEGEGISGINARDESGKILPEHIRRICESLFQAGVKGNAVIHCPEAGFWLNNKGGFFVVPSLDLPKGYIKGTVGAGDAFAAGTLYALYNGMSEREGLVLASCAAACNLSAEDSISGMRGLAETMELDKRYGRK